MHSAFGIAKPAPIITEQRVPASECDCTDLIGPFEMDGNVDGVYVQHGAWWTVCRGCGKSRYVDYGQLTSGTRTKRGVVVGRTDTAYEMEDGSFVGIAKLHYLRPASPLVVVR